MEASYSYQVLWQALNISEVVDHILYMNDAFFSFVQKTTNLFESHTSALVWKNYFAPYA